MLTLDSSPFVLQLVSGAVSDGDRHHQQCYWAHSLLTVITLSLISDVQGTVNDPTTFPAPNKAHGSYHWTFERALSAALVPLVASTAVSSVNPVVDGVLAVALVAHTHIVSIN